MSGTDSHGGTTGEAGGIPNQYPPTGGQPGGYPPPAAGQQFPAGGPSNRYPPPGQPGQPGQPFGGQPNPYTNPHGAPSGGAYGYGQPPSGGSGNKALWIILAAVAAFVVLALIAIVALVVASSDDDGEAGTAGKAGSQPAVVKAYLAAVAEGDAKKALSYAAVEPLTKDFLTDEVLADSAEIAKITDIRVGDVANEYTSTVPATYQLGDQTISQDFSVTKAGDDWKMRAAGSELDFTYMRKNTLPLLLNDQQVDVDKVMLFPGVYRLTSGSENVTYGDTGQLTVKGGSDFLRSSELTPTLSPEGEKAYVAAVKASVKACLKKKELSPDNCPNQAGNSQSYTIKPATIKWSQRGGTDPFANLQPRLDYQSPNVATSRPSLQLEIKAGCDAPSGTCTLSTYNSAEALVDMTKQPLVVRWVD